jgi:hypothetical protein
MSIQEISSDNITPPQFSVLIYHLGDRLVCVLPHRHDQSIFYVRKGGKMQYRKTKCHSSFTDANEGNYFPQHVIVSFYS